MLASFAPTGNFPSEQSADNPVAIRFTGLSNIPSNATVSDAFFTLFFDLGGAGAFSMSIRRLKRAWVETQATWNEYTTGNSWTTAGALSTANDIDGTDSCTAEYAGGFVTGDVNSITNTKLITDVQNIVSGAASNDGWRLGINNAALRSVMPGGLTASQRPLLTVTYTIAPTINTQPQPLTVYENEAAVFTISATSSGGALSYQWKQNGSNVGTNSSTLTISPAALTDNGTSITCDVTDSNATVVSNSVLLRVIPAARMGWIRA